MNGESLRTRRMWVLPVMLLAVALAFAVGCSKNSNNNPTNSNDNNPAPNEVQIRNNAFNPGTITVSVGTTVTWLNMDGISHTVTAGAPGSPTGQFNSGNLAPNSTFSHTFSAAGNYPYFCSIHTGMRGTVVVQ